MSKPETMMIDDVKYVRADSVQKPVTGNRAVVVIDRGWIFAGDVEEKDGRVLIHNALWVFKWSSVGFDGVIDNPGSKSVTIKKMNKTVDIPKGAEVFRVPVPDAWGM